MTANNTTLGPNVFVFNPSMPTEAVQDQADRIFKEMEANEFGSQRYALLFEPGEYNVLFDVGFYTSVAGLGQNPDNVVIRGGVNVPAYWMPNRNATCNFWRSFENFAVDASDATNKTTTIAVSQAAPLRRLHVISANGLWLFQVDPDTHAGGWASGGYMADTVVNGQVLPGSQQQWLSRNSRWGSWANGVWNMVFVGCEEAPSGANWPREPYTTIDLTPVIREKPYLYRSQDGELAVLRPALQRDARGPTWLRGPTPGESIPLSQFEIARAGATAGSLNAALRVGKHILFTPGIYRLDEPLHVTQPNTIILGLGFPSLIPTTGCSAICVADVDGVTIAGLILDAGATNSPCLLEVGPSHCGAVHTDNPTFLYDITVRTGGVQPGRNDVGICINSHDVVGDQLWLWRADHPPATAGWSINPTKNGVVVNGDRVTMYGLFNEHHQEYQTLWKGNEGRCYFYQSEIPYDPPRQEAYLSENRSRNGYASYKVADSVRSHEAWGLGVYCYFRDAPVKLENAIEAPATTRIHHMTTVWLNGTPGSEISHVVNGSGDRVYANNPDTAMRQTLNEFP